MTKSYRIRTQVNPQSTGDQTIRVNIEQDFDFLEILSLKLTQSDVYRRFCSDYGVIAGRVVANGGFGIPNARVSVFIPVEAIDLANPTIQALYPFRAPTDKNEDGYRYNLLPYEPSYEGHRATGTFPSKEDILTRSEVLEIYEKYYKYTVKTNDSGDFMIVGVPTGDQQIVVDLDLSDMGCFSLRPSDLIRMNRANRQQFDGNDFRESTDLNSLPQIVNLVRAVNVGSFWGENDNCNVGITRVDFDLREQNINIEPTAIFMGSVFSSSDEDYLKNNCKPKAEQGDLCGLVTGPGTILAIRQTINLDPQGRPILEQYSLPSGGKVIDENGAFNLDLPMNLDYLITDEFGNYVVSQDPSVGIPSKAKYRFKVKYNSSEKDIATFSNPNQFISQDFINLSAFAPKGKILRGNYLIPNIKEHGWRNNVNPSTKETRFINNDTKTFQSTTNNIEEEFSFFAPARTSYRFESLSGVTSLRVYINDVLDNSKWIDCEEASIVKVQVIKKTEVVSVNNTDIEQPVKTKIVIKQYDYDYVQFQKSYSFSLDWDDYVSYEDAINCEDIFYEFHYNKVYTTALLIDEYRRGTARARTLSIKEILQRSCQSEVNKFPVNDGVRNFDILYFIISIIFNLIVIILAIFILTYSIFKLLWKYIIRYILAAVVTIVSFVVDIVAFIVSLLSKSLARRLRSFSNELRAFAASVVSYELPGFKLPMLTYPDCSSCDCGESTVSEIPPADVNNSPLADINIPETYVPYKGDEISETQDIINTGFGQVVAGRNDFDSFSDFSQARTPRYTFNDYINQFWVDSETHVFSNNNGEPRLYHTLPIPERVNIYNTKGHYFDTMPFGGSNRIKVQPNFTVNNATNDFYEDQPLVVLCDEGFLNLYKPGSLVSFISPTSSKDVNISASTQTANILGTNNVTGTTPTSGTNYQVQIKYANPQDINSMITKTFTVVQDLYPSGVTSYSYPADIEYYQVVTGYTLSEMDKLITNVDQNSNLYKRSFWRRVVRGVMMVGWAIQDKLELANNFWGNYTFSEPLSTIDKDDRDSYVVAILMKGVDPYSPRQNTKIDVSRIFGYEYGKFVCEGKYKLNIPIQVQNTGLRRNLRLDDYSAYTTNQDTQIFYPSYFFTPSQQTSTDKNWKYSAFTTNNHRLYSAYRTIVGANGPVGANGNNQFINYQPDGYWNNEYIEGGGLMIRREFRTQLFKSYAGKNQNIDVGDSNYERYVYSPTGNTLNIVDRSKIVMRTDRLPRSDVFNFNFVLAQNKNFAIYSIPDVGFSNQVLGGFTNTDDFTTGDGGDFAESYGTGATSTLSTFNCNKMVPVGAYKQENGIMTVKPETDESYYIDKNKTVKIVENGCYQFAMKDTPTIGADWTNLGEWRSRFLIGLAVCRNVFGMTFTNQWINGTLYMPGFQNDKIYDNALNVSNPRYVYCKDKLSFRIENNSFFYRSSPYNSDSGFVGMLSSNPTIGNRYFLGSPTTVVDLGPKDNIIKNICAKPEFQGYFVGQLQPTTYNSLSDLIQLFVVSRLSNADFLLSIIGLGGASVQQFFSRKGDRIDGDFAQMASINSEYGVAPFSPESYKDNSIFFNGSKNPTLGIFFTADTQQRDFISPGREIFIDTYKKFGYNQFGKKSQVVPMYKWNIVQDTKSGVQSSIFGSEKNDWSTNRTIVFDSYRYQSIDRLDNTYFKSKEPKPSTQRPGYIYSSTAQVSPITQEVTGFTYSAFDTTYTTYNPFLVGAPNHFYFGLKVGKTALDKFIRDYAIEI